MLIVFTILALTILALYSFLILSFFAGWLRTRRWHPDQKAAVTRVSILIPCRNEAENIAELSVLLEDQDYPGDLLEVIWIDDHSTDGTPDILSDRIQGRKHMHVARLDGSITGKKAALKLGMESASGELILLTDADSRPGPRWVKIMAKYFEDTRNDLIIGPVVLDPARTWFDQIQKLEYLSLVASSIGAAGIGRPIMAQGPNIAVRATDYANMVDDLDNRFASGDDVFLLQAMKKLTGKKIGYVMNPDAIVRSKPAKSLTDFMHQRQRWASKAKGYLDRFMILTTLVVFIANLEILATAVFALVGLVPAYLVLILLGIKTLADLPILFVTLRFFSCTKLVIWLLPVQVLYPFYIGVAGILSQISRIRWKNHVGAQDD